MGNTRYTRWRQPTPEHMGAIPTAWVSMVTSCMIPFLFSDTSEHPPAGTRLSGTDSDASLVILPLWASHLSWKGPGAAWTTVFAPSTWYLVLCWAMGYGLCCPRTSPGFRGRGQTRTFPSHLAQSHHYVALHYAWAFVPYRLMAWRGGPFVV